MACGPYLDGGHRAFPGWCLRGGECAGTLSPLWHPNSQAAQLAGSIVLIAAAGASVPLLLPGIILFGAGFGNATSLPPLVAQVEFVKDDKSRAVAIMVGIAQGAYAFAPATFGLIRDLGPDAPVMAPGAAPYVFAAAGIVQALAIAAFLAGRYR